jgi:hypothetical protein
VLTKQKALFQREGALRKQQQMMLGWLKRQRPSFSVVFETPQEASLTI